MKPTRAGQATPEAPGTPVADQDAPSPGPAQQKMAEALAAEHAAIFAYGPIGVRLDDELAALARETEQVHRRRRDELQAQLEAAGAPAPPGAASYELPFEVTDADAAMRLAILVEERVAAVWRPVLRETIGTARAGALDALVDAALRATRWRAAAGVEPVTVPFPGSPE